MLERSHFQSLSGHMGVLVPAESRRLIGAPLLLNPEQRFSSMMFYAVYILNISLQP